MYQYFCYTIVDDISNQMYWFVRYVSKHIFLAIKSPHTIPHNSVLLPILAWLDIFDAARNINVRIVYQFKVSPMLYVSDQCFDTELYSTCIEMWTMFKPLLHVFELSPAVDYYSYWTSVRPWLASKTVLNFTTTIIFRDTFGAVQNHNTQLFWHSRVLISGAVKDESKLFWKERNSKVSKNRIDTLIKECPKYVFLILITKMLGKSLFLFFIF